MTSERKGAKKSAKMPKPEPMAADTLTGHLTTKTSNASKFIYQLAARPEKEISDEDLTSATEAVQADRALVGRVAEIAGLANTSAEFRARKTILRWAGELIHQIQPGLEGWRPGLAESSVSLIVPLAKRSISKGADPKEKQAADAVLQTAVAVLMGQYAWSSIQVLQELTSGFDIGRRDATKEAPPPAKPGQLVAKLLGRATARQLQEYATVGLLLNSEMTAAREQARKAVLSRQEQYDRYLAAKTHGDQLAAEIAAQKEHMAALQSQAQALEAQLASMSSGAAHGQTNFRARYRSFLTRKLSPNVTDALDALDGPDPYVDVAVERLKFLKSDISKEVAWLDGSSE